MKLITEKFNTFLSTEDKGATGATFINATVSMKYGDGNNSNPAALITPQFI